MDTRLRALLARIRDQGEASGLPADDLAYLARLVGPAEADDDAPRPVWTFLRRQALLFRGIFQLDANRSISGIEHVLADAGAAPGTRYKPSAHFVQEVRLTDLHDAVRRNLASPETDRRTAAATLVGMAELHDLAPILVDALASGREARASYGQPVIAACLESLVRLGHPRTGELALEHLSSEDYSVRQVLVPTLLASADQVGDAELARVLRGDFQSDLVRAFGGVLARLARSGALDVETVRRVVTDNQWDAGRCLASADLLIAAGMDELAIELVGQQADGLATALALRSILPAGGAADPTTLAIVEALRAALDTLTGTTRSAAVLAIASHGADPTAFLLEHLDGDPDSALGAVWGALGRATSPGIEEALERHAAATDPATLRRAARFVLAHRRGADPQLAEIHWLQLLQEEEWWPWQMAVEAAGAARIEVPAVVELFASFTVRPPFGDRERLERLVAGFTAEPWHLVRWLDRRDTSTDQRLSAVLFAALVGTPLMRSALEHSMLASTEHWVEENWVLALSTLGGAQSATGRVRQRLLVADYNEEPRLDPELKPAAVAMALWCKNDLARTAIRALASFGGEVEDEIALLLSSDDEQVADAAAAVAAKLRDPALPLVADVGRLLGGRVTAVRELETAPQLLRLPSKVVRLALVELCGRADNRIEEVAPLLFLGMADADVDVAAAALASWAAHAGDRPWVGDLVVAIGQVDQWAAPERAMKIMAQLGDPAFLPQIALHLGTDDNSGRVDAAIAAVSRIADTHPEAGVVVLDVREPWKVRERFALPHEEIRQGADNHAEALRLMMLGLTRRTRAADVAAKVGQRVMLTPLSGDLPTAETRVRSDALEGLLMHLSVVFADEETGSIVAEVTAAPSGEVLTALLQARPVAAAVVSWT